MEEKLVFMNCRIPSDLKVEIKKLAIDKNISVQDLCRKLLELGIDNLEK